MPRFSDYKQLPPLDGWHPYWEKRKLGSVTGKAEAIVWHYTVGGLSSSLQHLRTSISAHFVVDRNGDVFQIIDTDDAAWTQGVYPGDETGHWINQKPGNENQWCVGVEIVNMGYAFKPGLGAGNPDAYEPYPQAQVAALVALRDKVCAAHNIPIDREHQVGHSEIDKRKSDPGPLFPWQIIATMPAPVPVPVPLPSWEDAYRQLQAKFLEDLKAGADSIRLANAVRDFYGGAPDSPWPAQFKSEGDRLNAHFAGRA